MSRPFLWRTRSVAQDCPCALLQSPKFGTDVRCFCWINCPTYVHICMYQRILFVARYIAIKRSTLLHPLEMLFVGVHSLVIISPLSQEWLALHYRNLAATLLYLKLIHTVETLRLFRAEQSFTEYFHIHVLLARVCVWIVWMKIRNNSIVRSPGPEVAW